MAMMKKGWSVGSPLDLFLCCMPCLFLGVVLSVMPPMLNGELTMLLLRMPMLGSQ